MDFNRENNSIIIGRILARSLSGAVTAAEQAVLDDWLQDDRNLQTYEAIRNGQSVSDALSEFDGFDTKEGYQRFQASIRGSKGIGYKVLMAAAAAGLLFLTVSVTLYMVAHKESHLASHTAAYSDDVPPGGNRAMLTLADGRSISLDSAQSGIVIGDENITYQDGSGLALLSFEGGKEEGQTVEMLILSTPRGGQYQVILPDGTEVWLNAASTLKYPSRFTGLERVVEIVGEGYFSVASDTNRPFRVLSKGQIVEVLGTEFNVSAYPDESEIKTTLVEGSVQVAAANSLASPIRIKPGQQSKLKNGNISVDDVNTNPYIAWKSGMFHFKHTSFEDMMRQIERWYDVEIVYSSRVPLETFSGRMRRDVSLLTVLDLLKASEISFRIEGAKLIIE